MVKQIKGNLITLAKKGEFEVILHGCNIFCTMGSGIAKSIKEEWPEAYDVDLLTKSGDTSKLGTISFTHNIPNLTIVNCYTQEKYGRDVKVYADYDAIEKAMIEVKSQFLGKKIGMPKIGAGLARGDWSIILPIIEKVFCDPGDDVTIVELDPNDDDQKNSKTSLPYGKQSGIISKLSAFNKPTMSSQTTTYSNNSTPTITTMATPVKKKFRGKRKCKVCNTYHKVKDMQNYALGVWICKQNCNQSFVDKVVLLNELKLVSQVQQAQVAVN